MKYRLKIADRYHFGGYCTKEEAVQAAKNLNINHYTIEDYE